MYLYDYNTFEYIKNKDWDFFMKFFFMLVTTLFITGCHAGFTVSEMDANQIKTVSDKDLCDTYNWNLDGKTESVLSEVKRRKLECDPAAVMCLDAGLKRGDPKFPSCFMQAKSIISQSEAANRSNAIANQKMIQDNLNATRPRTCTGYGNSVTCY